MPTGYQIKDQSACYYLTFQIVYWIDLFQKQVYRDIVVESIKYCQKEKGHAAKRQNKEGEYQVWTHENHAEEVYGNDFIQTKVRYIHENPVRAGLVRNAADYLYSSAGTYAGQEGLIDIIPIVMTIEKRRR
jgi:hypothetical protein